MTRLIMHVKRRSIRNKAGHSSCLYTRVPTQAHRCKDLNWVYKDERTGNIWRERERDGWEESGIGWLIPHICLLWLFIFCCSILEQPEGEGTDALYDSIRRMDCLAIGSMTSRSLMSLSSSSPSQNGDVLSASPSTSLVQVSFFHPAWRVCFITDHGWQPAHRYV